MNFIGHGHGSEFKVTCGKCSSFGKKSDSEICKANSDTMAEK